MTGKRGFHADSFGSGRSEGVSPARPVRHLIPKGMILLVFFNLRDQTYVDAP